MLKNNSLKKQELNTKEMVPKNTFKSQLDQTTNHSFFKTEKTLHPQLSKDSCSQEPTHTLKSLMILKHFKTTTTLL